MYECRIEWGMGCVESVDPRQASVVCEQIHSKEKQQVLELALKIESEGQIHPSTARHSCFGLAFTQL